MAALPQQAEYTQEVRFAVVMYGGVSLAIYINGIAQELLRIVRSTSASRPDAQGNPNRTPVPAAELTGTERVYRRLSCLLSDPQLLKQFRESLETAPPLTTANANDPKSPDIVDQRTADNIVNTRFVVDVLSGTSAGGINAIYLAKALANDQKLDELKTLWITEGDIALLLNDKKSVAGLYLDNQQPPQSLLNSRRMYFKLLNAFQGMEKSRKSVKGFVSPHVDELDLFITTTDLEGMLVPLRLSDTVVFERRHRNVFHFKYATPEATGTQRNDFLEGNDPFLAFAALYVVVSLRVRTNALVRHQRSARSFSGVRQQNSAHKNDRAVAVIFQELQKPGERTAGGRRYTFVQRWRNSRQQTVLLCDRHADAPRRAARCRSEIDLYRAVSRTS
jgi:patatin-related protein